MHGAKVPTKKLLRGDKLVAVSAHPAILVLMKIQDTLELACSSLERIAGAFYGGNEELDPESAAAALERTVKLIYEYRQSAVEEDTENLEAVFAEAGLPEATPDQLSVIVSAAKTIIDFAEDLKNERG